MPEFAPGDVFVNHRILGLAGRGGMGVVYRALDLDLDRTVALKVIAPALADDPDFRARFVAESKAAASIEHPHVIPVYYAGEREGVLFIVMRYVDGPDLRALVRAEGTLDPERAAQIVAQVGGALDAAHAHGLVHRDVKPANVLLGNDDHAYLTDFGLTKREASTGAGLSRPGGWVGTLGFVAPEQIRGERVDARTDVYALGCVLVHALTGGAPYIRDSDEATLWAHLNSPPPVDRVPEEFAGIVERALSKDPADRFPSAGDLGRAALAAAGRSAAPGPERNVARGAAAPEGTPQTAATARASMPAHEGETHVSPPADHDGEAETVKGRASGSRRAALAAAGVLVLAAGAFASALLGGGDDPPNTPTTPTSRTVVSETPRAAIAGRTRPIATRPNSITVSKGRVWVLSGSDGKIVVLDTKTMNPVRRVVIRPGGSAVTSGLDSIWAIKQLTGTLMRFDPKTGRRKGAAIGIGVAGEPISVTTGANAVWVAVRKRGRRDGSGESLVRIDTRSDPPAQEVVEMPGGAQDVAYGEGAIWVTNLYGSSVTRVDPQNIHSTRRIRGVGGAPNGVAVGEGAVWVAAGLDKALVRINPQTQRARRTSLGVEPTRVAVGGGSVWVTARYANKLFRVDPQTRRVVEEVQTGIEPFALDVAGGNSVWLTLVDEQGGDGVQRVRFYPQP
jgi:streptogramin lyase